MPMNMNATINFSYKIKIHLFNGYACEAEGFGVVVVNDKKPQLPEETILALIHLGAVLRPICEQMLASGWVFLNGRLTKPEQLEQKV